MAFLIVGGVTVKVAVGQAAEDRPQIGEVVIAFDGSPRSSVQGRRYEWEITTAPITEAEADTLLAALEGSHPVTCSGDLIGGTLGCIPTEIKNNPVKISGATRYRAVSFRLLGSG